MKTQTGFADVNRTRLYYEMAGSGHPLVLIHGNTLDTRMWDDQFEVFAQHYQALRYDVRGFGKSAVPTTEPYTHPDDLRALMTHLGIDHAHIIGLSMGGAIAINFAWKTSHRISSAKGCSWRDFIPFTLQRMWSKRSCLNSRTHWIYDPTVTRLCMLPLRAWVGMKMPDMTHLFP